MSTIDTVITADNRQASPPNPGKGLFRTKNIEAMLADKVTATHAGLRKVLGPIDLIFLGVGAIIGTGIFVLTGTGALMAGPALVLSFILGGITCAFAALAYAEFSSSIPVAGSIYTYSYATMGELLAWIIGWDLVLEYGLATATVSVGWSGYLQSLLAGFHIALPTVLTAAPGAVPGKHTLFNLPAFLIVMVIASLLSIGIKESTRVNNIMVAIKLAVVALVIVMGVKHIHPVNWHPFMPMGWHGVFSGAAIVFFSYIGFDAVSSAAEEVKTPKRDLPIGIIGSLLLCTVLYIVVSAILTGIVPWKTFAGTGMDSPVAFAFKQIGEGWASGFISLGAIIGMFTVMLVMFYGQTRILFAMSRDGLLPKPLSRVHPRFQTPLLCTWLVGLVFGLFGALVPLNVLAELANIGTLAAFAMVSVAVIILRKTHPELPRAFRCPGVPVVPLLAIASCLFLMINLQRITWEAFGIWLIIGLVIYFSYSRRHSHLARQLNGSTTPQ